LGLFILRLDDEYLLHKKETDKFIETIYQTASSKHQSDIG
jgi:hypothetical protein